MLPESVDRAANVETKSGGIGKPRSPALMVVPLIANFTIANMAERKVQKGKRSQPGLKGLNTIVQFVKADR
jgi:hypothetical protein